MRSIEKNFVFDVSSKGPSPASSLETSKLFLHLVSASYTSFKQHFQFKKGLQFTCTHACRCLISRVFE
jgi:hypothetical protein